MIFDSLTSQNEHLPPTYTIQYLTNSITNSVTCPVTIKIRSYASISLDEIFEMSEKGLCELCDEIYFPRHKCKKMGSNFLVVLVDEDDTTQYNFCLENHPLVDALQEKCIYQVK